MGPREFLSRSRVVIVAGKGGVGKTTVSATLARVSVEAGLRPLVIDVGGGHGVARVFGRTEALTDEECEVAPGIRARAVNPDMILSDYLESRGMGRLSRGLARRGILDVLATATPGVKDLLVLSRVRQLERQGEAEVIIVDAPATGHAISFLRAAGGILDTVDDGALHTQAREVQDMLADDTRCRALLVTLAEETPVNELIDFAFALEDKVGIGLAPVVVNSMEPPLGDAFDLSPLAIAAREGLILEPGEAESMEAAAAYRRGRRARQETQTRRLAEALPLPQLRLPALPLIEMGPSGIDLLAEAFVTALCDLPTGDLPTAKHDGRA